MIRPPRSLLARILWWHGIAVLATALAVSTGVYLFLDATADHLERQTLRSQAVALRRAIAVDAAGRPAIAPPASAARPPIIAAGMSVVLLDRVGRPAIPPPSPPPLAVSDIPRRDADAYFTRRSRHVSYAGLSVPTTIGGRRMWIVAIQNLDDPANVADDIVRQFLWYGLAIVLPLLLLLLGIDAWIVTRALRPVRRASALVRTIDPARLDVRLADPAIPAEVQPLTDAVDAALDRLTASLRLQRDFTADAAHELRTPITIARIRAAEIADPALRGAVIADLDALARIVGQLLAIAELDSLDGMALAPVDLSAVAARTVASVAPLAFRGGRTIAFADADRPVIVRAHPDFLARALGALVENAITHTPPGTHVVVRVMPDGRVVVVDDGPGIPAADQPSIFRRFWRGDRSAGAHSGLGLAIVQRVAAVQGGTATCESRPGRTAFTLTSIVDAFGS